MTNRLLFRILFSAWRIFWLIPITVYPHMQKKLQECFGSKIIQTEINGKPNVATFRSKAQEVLYDFYRQCDCGPEKDKLRIIKAAARLIKDDIKGMETSYCNYPAIDDLRSEESINFLPEVFLTNIFVGSDVHLKVASIGQAVMQAA